MGAVYEVLDEKTTGARALKVMLPNLLENEGLRARFALEARITGGIESDHIVRTFDAGVDERTSTPFIVMDLLRGEDLGGVIKRRKALPPAEVALYMHQTARALDKTHAAGIVHRDLKPDNLFLTIRDDGSPCIKILDFGIAKVTVSPDPSIKTRPMMGTPLYMSPEQVRNERNIGPAADVYAIGHITYTLLVGETYWSEEADNIPSPFLLISEIMHGAKDPPSARALRRKNITLPEAFDPWFFRMTSLTPESRFDRATEAVYALADALSIQLPRPSLQPYLAPSPGATGSPVGGPTNPLGEECPPEERSTGDLNDSSVREAPAQRPTNDVPSTESPAPRAIDMPTVATGHARARETPPPPAPLETGVSKKDVETQFTGVEGPASAPISAMSPLRLTAEEAAAQTMAATADLRRPSPSRDKAPPVIQVQDRSNAPMSARDSFAASARELAPSGRDRPGATALSGRDRQSSPDLSRDRPASPAISRDRQSSPDLNRDRTPSSLFTRDRLTPPSSAGSPPPTVARERPTPPQPQRPPLGTPTITPARDKPQPTVRGTAVPARTMAPVPSRDATSLRKEPAGNRRFSITIDHARRILRLRVWGFWTLDEVKAYVEDFNQKARQLVGKPWYVLADISDFPPQKDEVNALLAEPMKFARMHGMVRAANLVSSALPKMLISRMSAETGLPEFSFFSSETEALAWLLHD